MIELRRISNVPIHTKILSRKFNYDLIFIWHLYSYTLFNHKDLLYVLELEMDIFTTASVFLLIFLPQIHM